MLLSLDGKILHLKELDFIERTLFGEVLSPDDFYKDLKKFLEKDFDWNNKQVFTTGELKRVDEFITTYFSGRIEEAKIWLLRAYIVGRYLAETDLSGAIFNLGLLNKLPKFVIDAAKRYGLSIEEAEALRLAVEDGASLMSNTTASTIQTVRNAIVESIKQGQGSGGVFTKLKELITSEVGELNRDWMRTCFPAGTIVITKRGKVPIEEVKVGDEVITINSKFGKKVIELHKREYSGDLYTIKTVSGKEITATAEHPIRVKRKNRNRWIQISQILETDEIFGIEGYQTYYDKDWLYQKHIMENIDCKQIAKLVNINPSVIRENLHLFNIPIKKDLAFSKRSHTESYKTLMSQKATEGEYWKRLSTKEASQKSSLTRKRKFHTGEIQGWSKNLNKSNHTSIMQISQKLKKGYENGRKNWNFGLTKNNSEIIKKASEKWKQYYKTHPDKAIERHRKQSITLAKSIADGKIQAYSYGYSGHLLNPFTGINEYYRSNFEKIFAEYCIKNNLSYKMSHGITIKYIANDGSERLYIPDFLLDNYIIETKSSWQVKHNYRSALEKISAATLYAKTIDKEFLLITENELRYMV